MASFNQFELPEALRKALVAMNFSVPTPIQAEAIPVALAGMDVIGCAQTGTGKTVAFAIPLINRLLQFPNDNGLVLAPTRELAEQVVKVLNELVRYVPELRPALIIGGMALERQKKFLERKPRIIVATPGRLLDHVGRGTVDLGTIRVLVVDEADRMLDMGFAPQLNSILKSMPQKHQTLLFSATFPPDIAELTRRYMRDPARVSVNEEETAAPLIEQSIVELAIPEKNDALLDEVNARKGSILVFTRTKSRTDRVTDYLKSYGVPVERIHGGRTQAQRRRALDSFRDGSVRVLVATDVAARGIDITHVGHVVNYDLPTDPEDYVHRIGRTGRAGRSGEAVSFVTPEDKHAWRAITHLLGVDEPRGGRRGGGGRREGGRREARGEGRRADGRSGDRRTEDRRDGRRRDDGPRERDRREARHEGARRGGSRRDEGRPSRGEARHQGEARRASGVGGKSRAPASGGSRKPAFKKYEDTTGRRTTGFRATRDDFQEGARDKRAIDGRGPSASRSSGKSSRGGQSPRKGDSYGQKRHSGAGARKPYRSHR